jgi:hypothetical protein
MCLKSIQNWGKKTINLLFWCNAGGPHIRRQAVSEAMAGRRVTVASVAILCIAVLASTRQAAALSYELCDSYGAEWVTDGPRLTGSFPYYSLLFSCNSEYRGHFPFEHPFQLVVAIIRHKHCL